MSFELVLPEGVAIVDHAPMAEVQSGRWVRLVPVEVFGAQCDHPAHAEPLDVPLGLSDAVSGWSDCNRAWGSIFRLDDIDYREDADANTVRVWVPDSEYPKLTKRWSDQ